MTRFQSVLVIGLLTAIYLSEYAPAGLRRVLKPVLEVLAGIPTVVYGYFALLFVTPLLQRFMPDLAGFNALFSLAGALAVFGALLWRPKA